jgi:hypothetical protein
MTSKLRRFIDRTNALPLAWAGGTAKSEYLNFGDALSPVMVALCSGLPIERIPFKAAGPRIAAVGTIGHGIEGGSVWFWGAGSSKFRNPGEAEPQVYSPPPDTEIHINATRGPISRGILGGETPPPGAIYGDPVWALPRFYENTVPKTHELGVIMHLSELADREFVASAKPHYKRFDIPSGLQGSVRLINTLTEVSAAALRDKLDEILSCKRIVSTSVHGMVIAESFGIPCLYFSPRPRQPGVVTFDLDPDSSLDLRIVDLYAGIGLDKLTAYAQPRELPTDWETLIADIDAAWTPKSFDVTPLLEAFPIGLTPLSRPQTGTVFELPQIASLAFKHSVGDLQRADRVRAPMWAA